MERAHAVMQPAEKFNDYVPSDSGIGYDAETTSFFTEVSITVYHLYLAIVKTIMLIIIMMYY